MFQPSISPPKPKTEDLQRKPGAPAPPFPPFPPVKKSEEMHPLYHKASGLTEEMIGAAIEVHRDKGPGLIESIYEWCLIKELDLRSLAHVSQ